MGVKVGTSCLHWTQPSVPQPPHTLPSKLSSPSLKRCSFSDGALIYKLHRSTLSNHHHTIRRSNPIRRSCSAAATSGSPSFSDEEFSKQLQELAARFLSESESESELDSDSDSDYVSKAIGDNLGPVWPVELPDWPMEPPEMISGGIERRASSVELPLSLRIIKRKRQWQEGFQDAGQSAFCSVKKAFSNMVLIIRELQCFAIQTRETIVYEDLQGILSRVQKEIHASFVWLFQQVFSSTPTLMIYVMILLANYSVYSVTAVAAPPPPPATVSIMEYDINTNINKFNSSSVRSFFVSDSGKMESVSGGSGGGGSFRKVDSGTDGGGKFWVGRTVVPDVVREDESVSGQEMGEEEGRVWDSIVDAAMKMRSEALDGETMRRFVSPVFAKMELEDYANYFRTELNYQMGLAQDPINPLLLANYAQFLYLVTCDFNRAEEYFKRAVKVDPPDAEALNKYASFLWQAKKDLWGAEENYLDAISADPTNSYYAANYAHFLWSTGGEDTCFPIDTLDCDNA